MTSPPLACVIGDMDLIRPLGLAGIKCVAAGPRGAPPRWSRHTVASIDLPDLWDEPEQAVDELIGFAQGLPSKPVLIYQKDPAALAIARYRERLDPWYRFTVPSFELVSELVDKRRFHARALELGLPVPRTVFTRAGVDPIPTEGLDYPVIVKPVLRDRPNETWKPVAHGAKAVRSDTPRALAELLDRPELRDVDLVVQEFVAGPETEILSYHTFIDTDGSVIGDFTGRKIRTRPASFGQSTAVEITDNADVRAAGQKALDAFDYRGIAKVDLKKSPDGSLSILEINPRFTLWNHPGAVAGVNIPAAVYRRLTDGTVQPLPRAEPGVRWCQVWGDASAARDAGVSLPGWARWVAGTSSRRAMHRDDPLAAFGVVAYGTRLTGRRLARSVRKAVT